MCEWMNRTWWLYDLTVAAIVLLCVWGGWQRGLIRTLSGLLGYGAAAILAGFFAGTASEYVYDQFLEDRCISVLEQKLDKYHLDDSIEQALSAFGIQLDPDMLKTAADNPKGASDAFYGTVSQKTGLPDQMIKDALSQIIHDAAVHSYTGLPSWMAKALVPDKLSSSELQDRIIQTAALLLSGDSHSAAAKLTRQYLRPVILSPLKVFMYSLLFLLISAALQVIIKWLGSLRRTESSLSFQNPELPHYPTKPGH